MPTQQSAAQQARNALGAAIRRGDPAEEVERLRAELEAVRIEAHIEAIDAAGRAGTMTPDQRDRMSRMFRYLPDTEEAGAA